MACLEARAPWDEAESRVPLSPPVMATLSLITAEDFERIAPFLGPCELVAGEIVRMSPAGVRHSMVTGRIFFALESWNQAAKLGRVMTNETGIVVRSAPDTVRGADVLFISYRRLPASEDWEGFLRHPPELVVEVFSKDDSWKKMEEKISDYHAFGVDLVCVADPQTRSVRVYPKGGEPSLLQAADELDGADLLPGFKCPVARFFAD